MKAEGLSIAAQVVWKFRGKRAASSQINLAANKSCFTFNETLCLPATLHRLNRESCFTGLSSTLTLKIIVKEKAHAAGTATLHLDRYAGRSQVEDELPIEDCPDKQAYICVRVCAEPRLTTALEIEQTVG